MIYQHPHTHDKDTDKKQRRARAMEYTTNSAATEQTQQRLEHKNNTLAHNTAANTAATDTRRKAHKQPNNDGTDGPDVCV